MDTPSSVQLQSQPSPIMMPRWLRVGGLIGLILFVQGAVAYLLSWVDPPHAACFVSIQIARYTGEPEETDWPFTNSVKGGTALSGIQATLDGLSARSPNEPVIVYLSALALQAESGNLFLLPANASPSDPATWLPLQYVLEKLKACPAQQKLLVLDLAPPRVLESAWRDHVYLDIGAGIARELDAVPDADRLVLCSASPGQTPHRLPESGRSVFAHYFRAALRGHADGYGDLPDRHVCVKEVAAFVQARVDRWAWHNRGERQTPLLLGAGRDFPLISVDADKPTEAFPAAPAPTYPESLLALWKQRDAFYRSGAYRLTPSAFQKQQGTLHQIETSRHGEREWKPMQQFQHRALAALAETLPTQEAASDAARRTFDEDWRGLQQKLASAKPADAERLKKRFADEARAKLSARDRDAIVFAHALADPRLDPGAVRLYDQLLHATPQTLPRSAETLRLRQVADLAMRVEVTAWPRDLIEVLLHATAVGEKALRQTPYLPGYVDLLEEPSLARHAGEVRLLTPGYSSLEDAKRYLTDATQKFERLIRLNEKWRTSERTLDEALAELPWYLEALEALPELRTPWENATTTARALAETLQNPPADRLPWLTRVAQWTGQIETAEKHATALQQNRRALHAPFARDELAQMERQCRSPQGNAQTLRNAEALLSVAAPVLQAQDRSTLWQAAHTLSRRLHNETLALDRQDNDAQRCTPIGANQPVAVGESRRAELRAGWRFALLELAGVSQERLLPLREELDRCKQDTSNPTAWRELGAKFRRVRCDEPKQQRDEKSWRERERLAWVLSPWDSEAPVDWERSPTIEHRRRAQAGHARWLDEHHRYLARDFRGVNLESHGIVAARGYYGQKQEAQAEAHLLLNLAASVEPLTEKQPYSHVWLEVTRQVPPGAFGAVELQFHRADDVWLEVAPGSASLPALAHAKGPRTTMHKVPLKVARVPKAERTGLPPPLGFLIEAQFAGRSYHHLVTAPIVPSTQQVQILVSADPDEPATTLNEIRVRPGKVKQPHYIYLRNLTNRPQKVHFEIQAGEVLLHKSQKPLTLEPDGVRKLIFEEGKTAEAMELRGPLVVRVFDQDRHKTLEERSLPVAVLSPYEYVKTGEASYEPGNKWAVQVQASRPVVGPAIVAQLVLPVQRIPGLMGVGGGTLHVELPTLLKSPRILFAEKLRLVHAAEEEGPVYLHIDGVARAFVYRTTFSRAGEPNQPQPDHRPAVRLLAPPCVMAGIHCLVDVEVDNAPPGCKLEIALGRIMQDNSFKTEIVREFSDAKKRRIDLEASKDALVFAATINDWTATFDTRAIVGARALRARLLDAEGQELAQSQQSLVIDDSAPIARIAPTPAQVKRGSVLQVQAQGSDPESGVAQVVFFYGKPDKGEIPLTAPRFKATPANREATQWSASLLVPVDHKGPLALSVHVVNHAGLASIDTVMLDITEREPGKTGLGEIRGKVVEGPRLQPNLTVILTDERGKEIARTRTQADGSYLFAQVAPGRYRVVCVKPESQRRAVLGVIVEPDRMARVDLALTL